MAEVARPREIRIPDLLLFREQATVEFLQFFYAGTERLRPFFTVVHVQSLLALRIPIQEAPSDSSRAESSENRMNCPSLCRRIKPASSRILA